jgi:type IV pilus assembly protein PilY1
MESLPEKRLIKKICTSLHKGGITMKKLEAITHIIFLALCICILGINVVQADDTDIFSGGIINVPPNVMIIFDTSGSMAHNIPTSGPYDPAVTYSGSHTSNWIYYNNGTAWVALHKYKGSQDKGQAVLSDITCTSPTNVATQLSTLGYCTALLQESQTGTYPFICGSTSMSLATGNYLNYFVDDSAMTPKPKVDIAQQAIHDLLDSIGEGSARFGLMIFSGEGHNTTLPSAQQDRGGYVIAPIGSSHATIKTAVDNIHCWYPYSSSDTPYNKNYYTNSSSSGPQTSGGTPLAETLAEAGLYFSGGNSWANTSGQDGYPTTTNGLGVSGKYTSPIQWRCQKNYIIVVTDGCPTVDDGSGNGDNIFTRSNYIDNKSIGNYYTTSPHDIDQDNAVNLWSGSCSTCIDNGNTWMPEVAHFLYDVDLIDSTAKDNSAGASWNDTAFPTQRVVTYAIGFGGESNIDFLNHVTDSSHGHGKTYQASEGKALADALSGIFGEIMKNNENFVAPVVPVSKMNRVYAGNSLYISLFRPEDGPEWIGNLKKFGFSNSGQILDKNGVVADFDATTKPSSCWDYSTNDGLEVDMGGAGQKLLHQNGRSFLTYDTDVTGNPTNLLSAVNLFNIANSLITKDVLGLAATATAADRSDLINFIRAEDIYTPLTGTSKRSWILGDVLHSRPAVLRDGTNNIIFVGSNDGFLHCFVDSEGSTYNNLSDDTVSEQWCFVPWNLIGQLHQIRDADNHYYFVDGSPVLYQSGSNKYLTFGLRRGGSKYYTFKVGEVDSQNQYISGGYTTPNWAWAIPNDTFPSGLLLGQSWCQPRICNLKDNNSSYTALVLGGGYDTNQDSDTPAATDTKGATIFAVNAANGSLLSSLLKFTNTSANLSSMTHSIIDLVVYDGNGDGYDDSIYAGDMSGQVFAMKADKDSGVWSGRKLFQAGNGTSSTAQMKFFYAPDVASQGFKYTSGSTSMYSVYDYVYIGTGDREHPNKTTTDDRFYGIKNKNNTTIVTEADTNFIDVTYYSSGYVTPHDLNYLKSNDSDGWFIRMGYELGAHVRLGEKVVSAPIVFDGVVYFTTFSPNPPASGDQCSTAGAGQGYLYAVKYLTGEAAFNWYTANDTTVDGKPVAVYTEVDRHLALGGGIPPAPKLAVTPNGPVLIIGTKTVPITMLQSIKQYFWIQE